MVLSCTSRAEHDSNGFTSHCPKLPHSAAHTAHETIWESILRFSAEAMTTRMYHVLRCVSILPEYIHSYLYSCTTLSLLCPCHHFFFLFLLLDSHSSVQQGIHSPSVQLRLCHVPSSVNCMSLVVLPSWCGYLRRLSYMYDGSAAEAPMNLSYISIP